MISSGLSPCASLRERRRDVDRIGVVLLLIAHDDVAKEVEIRVPSVSVMRCVNLAMRLSLTVSADGSSIGSISLARRALDRAQQVTLARRDEQDRFAAAPRAAGAADSVHVGFGVVRNVEVDDVADPFDVEPARRDVGRDEDVELARS